MECVVDKMLQEEKTLLETPEDVIKWTNQLLYKRPQQIIEEKKITGKKLMSYFCLFMPKELFDAADVLYPLVVGSMSEKDIPFGEQYLPATYCPIPKCILGLKVRKGDILFENTDFIVSPADCGCKTKTWEYLNQFLPVHVYEVPKKFNEPDAAKYFEREIGRVRKRLEEYLGYAISDEKLSVSIRNFNKLRELQFELCGKLRSHIPCPIKGLDAFFGMVSSFFLDVKDSIRILEILNEKVRRRAEKGQGYNGARIMLTGAPIVWPTLKFYELVEANGGVVVGGEFCAESAPFFKFEDANLVDETGDPIEALARKYMRLPCAVYTPNTERIETLKNMVSVLKVDGIIYQLLEACHPFNAEFRKVKDAMEAEGIPVVGINTGFSDSDRAQIKVRIEGFMEMLKARKS